MSGSSKKVRRRREALFRQQNGICHWVGAEGCTTEMKIYESDGKRKHMPPDMCTLDHLYDRYDPNRLRPPINGTEQRLVAACHACNNRRGREREAQISLRTLQRRSRRAPRAQSPIVYSAGTTTSPTLADLWPIKGTKDPSPDL